MQLGLPRQSFLTTAVLLGALHVAFAFHCSHEPLVSGVPKAAKSMPVMTCGVTQESTRGVLSPWLFMHTVLAGLGTFLNGFETTTVARCTPIGSATWSVTEPPSLLTFHADRIGPLTERNSALADNGPAPGCTCGAIRTAEKPGRAGVMPARLFHIHSPMPPHRKIWRGAGACEFEREVSEAFGQMGKLTWFSVPECLAGVP